MVVSINCSDLCGVRKEMLKAASSTSPTADTEKPAAGIDDQPTVQEQMTSTEDSDEPFIELQTAEDDDHRLSWEEE